MSDLIVASELFEIRNSKNSDVGESELQSKDDENVQSRFLAANKKRIKTLNSLSRSRFQKPQPNIKYSVKRGTASPPLYISNFNVKRFQDTRGIRKCHKNEDKKRDSLSSSNQTSEFVDSSDQRSQCALDSSSNPVSHCSLDSSLKQASQCALDSFSDETSQRVLSLSSNQSSEYGCELNSASNQTSECMLVTHDHTEQDFSSKETSEYMVVPSTINANIISEITLQREVSTKITSSLSFKNLSIDNISVVSDANLSHSRNSVTVEKEAPIQSKRSNFNMVSSTSDFHILSISALKSSVEKNQHADDNLIDGTPIHTKESGRLSESVELLVNETCHHLSTSLVKKNSINLMDAIEMENAADSQEFETDLPMEIQHNSSNKTANKNELMLQNVYIKSLNVRKKKEAPLKAIKRTHFGKPRPNTNSLNKSTRHSAKETAEEVQTQKTLRFSDSSKLLMNANEALHSVTTLPVDENINNLNSGTAVENVESESLEIPIISSNIPKHNHINRNEAMPNLKKKKGALKTLKRTRFEKPQPNINSVIKNTGQISANEEVTRHAHASEKTKRLPDGFPEQDFVSNSSGGFSIDRAAKFPHLTSILTSKKRIENKEIPHKRKKFTKESPPERDKMTIMDLIYWNPNGTPMQCSRNQPNTNETSMNSNEDVTWPELENNAQEEEEEDTFRSVPKLVVGQNGEINIDQASLIVRRNLQDVASITDACNDDETTYSTFRKRPAKQWTTKETTEFYKALTCVGTDFGLMEKFFPGRTRRELKLKFKREERLNMKLVNMAIYESQTFNTRVIEEANENVEQIFTNNEDHINELDVNNMKSSRKNPGECIEDSTFNHSDSSSTCSVDDAQEFLEGHQENYPSEIINNRRKRKAKLLAQDFIDIDDFEMDDSDQEHCHDEVNSNKKKQVLSDDFIDDDLGIGEAHGAVNFIPVGDISNESVSVYYTVEKSQSHPDSDSNLRNYNRTNQDEVHSDKTSDRQLPLTAILPNENEPNECMKADFILPCNTSEIDILKNVVADEIVMSRKIVKKGRKKLRVPNIVRRKKVNVLNVNSARIPSSRNYTPAEEYPMYKEKHLQFTPEQNLKTYSQNKPEIENVFFTSFDTQDCSGNSLPGQNFESSEPDVNVSNNKPEVIPIVSDPGNTDVSSGPVMIFAKAPNEENIIHLFMYNTPTDMQENISTESLSLVS